MTAGIATRLCMKDGNWAEPNVLECESQEFLQILEQVTPKLHCKLQYSYSTNALHFW